MIGDGLDLVPRRGGVIIFGDDRCRRRRRQSRLDVLHEGFLRLLAEISEFRDLSAADGEFAAMMYDRVENREKRDQRIQIVVKELLRRR